MSKAVDAKCGDAKHTDAKRDDDRIHVPRDMMEALDEYAKVEKARQDNPVIAEMITKKSIAIHILRNELEKRGYLKRKEKKKSQPEGSS